MAIICCDIPEVMGSAIGVRLLTGLGTVPSILVSGLASLALLGVQLLGFQWFEGAVAIMMGMIGLSFLAEWARAAAVPVTAVAGGLLVPRIQSMSALYVAISLFGAVVMPHNLYLHSVRNRPLPASLLCCLPTPRCHLQATVLYRRPDDLLDGGSESSDPSTPLGQEPRGRDHNEDAETGGVSGRELLLLLSPEEAHERLKEHYHCHQTGTAWALGLSVLINVAAVVVAHSTASAVSGALGCPRWEGRVSRVPTARPLPSSRCPRPSGST